MKSFLLVLSASLAACLPAGGAVAPREPGPVLGLANITLAEFDDEAGGLQGRALQGPHMNVNFPDPAIIWGDGSWKAYSTSSDGKYIPVAVSNDAQWWSMTNVDALPDPGSWVDPTDRGIWAPDVNKNDNGLYVMYYSARRNGGSRCIGAATSWTAMGPFVPQAQPLYCDDAAGGVIDPAGYDDGVNRWIMWKDDGNSLGGATTCQGGQPSGDYRPTPIKIQRMARDALTLLDSPKVIMDHEGRNNNGVVEGPSIYKVRDDLFVLFYSAHCYSSDDYDIEYAWSDRIDGYYGDRGILLRTVDNRGIYGPGHMDIDPNGSFIVFHGRTGPNQGGGGTRYMYSAQLTIDGKRITF
ncbi:hypothetical protein DL769_009015 [Monosporascus sp. CRB-8-3]|nr:hypothetical protein DL769_009015 [Monosporascus sp. CRB-8-3]